MIKKEYFTQLMFILGIMKVMLIIILGIYIFMSSSFNYMPKYFRMIFAIVIIAYGFFRFVNILYKLKKRVA